MKRIRAGLNILAKYSDNGDFAAEHDQIWAGIDASEMEIDEEDLKELDDLGWFIDEEFDSWSHFC
jgi:hypothetical protein